MEGSTISCTSYHLLPPPTTSNANKGHFRQLPDDIHIRPMPTGFVDCLPYPILPIQYAVPGQPIPKVCHVTFGLLSTNQFVYTHTHTHTHTQAHTFWRMHSYTRLWWLLLLLHLPLPVALICNCWPFLDIGVSDLGVTPVGSAPVIFNSIVQ